MKNFLEIFGNYKKWSLAVLGPLGLWGLAVASIADAAAIPLPYDLIVAGYVWEYKKYFYLCVLLASAGTAIGGLLPYYIGRGGGELFLKKRIDSARFEKLRGKFERQEFLALMVPSILPPPMPWKLFVFGAGVFRMKVPQYLLAVFTGRIIRNSITATLTILYGPSIVHEATRLIHRHGWLILIVVLALVAYFVFRAVRKRRNHRRRSERKTPGDR